MDITKKENKVKKIISIIGGGSTGLSFLLQFIEKIKDSSLKDSFKVNFFEKSNAIGVGAAYNAKSHALLLNTPAGFFSIYPDNTAHFLQWLQAFPGKWKSRFPEIQEFDASTYLPRKLAGLYLKDIFTQILIVARLNNIEISIIQDEVINIQNSSEKVTTLLTKKAGNYKADYIILCTGNYPSNPFPHLISTPFYFESPHFQEKDIKKIRNFIDPILIVGTRLSAIDMVVMLRDFGYKGIITMASRRGNMPAVKSETKPHSLIYFTKENVIDQLKKNNFFLTIENLGDLIKEELCSLYDKEITYENIVSFPKQVYHGLKFDLRNAKRGGALWQKLLVSFVELIEEYWINFSLSEKRKFMKDYIGVMLRYTSSFPITNAEKLVRMIEDSSLYILDQLHSINYEEEEKMYSAFFSNGYSLHEKKFRYVINATGNCKDLIRSGAPLYINLFKENKAKFNEFGGLDVNISDKTFRVNMTQNFFAKIYAAGAPTFGSFFFTDSIFPGVKHSQDIIKDILLDNSMNGSTH